MINVIQEQQEIAAEASLTFPAQKLDAKFEFVPARACQLTFPLYSFKQQMTRVTSGSKAVCFQDTCAIVEA